MDRGTTRRFSAVRLLAVSSVLSGMLLASACERHLEAPPAAVGMSPAFEYEAPHAVSTQGRVATARSPAVAVSRCVEDTPEAPPPAVDAGPDPGCPPDPGRPELRRGRVVLAGAELDVELAETPADQTRGLMFRTAMADDAGMLFVFDQPAVHSFWMRNTCIPLDMLFIADDGLVVGIVENVPTMNELSRAVACPSRYVLEVNAGWCRAHGVTAGMYAALELEGA